MSEAAIRSSGPARLGLWAGRVLTGLVVLFLALDCAMKLADMPQVRAAAVQIGWPVGLDRTLGVTELVCLVLYAVPRTAVLGAILTTGLLGGAVAAHLRLRDPLLSHVLFGVYIGVMAWGGLWFRDKRLRALLPLVR
ncbi:MAG TPA: DoxX family protein [Rhizomicrobium sp.]|jgi:hypothetical protein